LSEGVFRDADAAGLGNPLEPRCDIDPVPENVLALDQDIAEVDANAPFHSTFARKRSIAVC
jgi:hypothetical protein